MKKSLLLIAFLLVCLFGFGQNGRPYFIRYRTANDTVYLNTQSVNGIHIDALGHELTHEDGTVWSALTDLDTVYIYREAEEYEWVDLGLPSGLLWATCNVGADSPEDYGDYFAWGEIQPKSYYDWSTYLYGNVWHELTKYCTDPDFGLNGFVDGLTILQPIDDAASANLGNNVRTPTVDEWEELKENCISVWTTFNGVDGLLFTSPNGRSLFFPAAGYCWEGDIINDGSFGGCWLSSLNTNSPCNACHFGYYSGGNYLTCGAYRVYGLSVRAVRSVPKN